MFKTVKLAGLVAVAAAGLVLAPNAFARHGADDPAGHVRQEDRQADKVADKAAERATDVRREDRAAEARHGADDKPGDVRREDRAAEARHGADDKPGDVRGGHDNDDPAGHQ